MTVLNYYTDHFPAELVCECLGREWRGENELQKREICIETADGVYMRWQSVADAQQLRTLFKQKNVSKFHTGAIFNLDPRHRQKKLALVPELRELVFDIDVNDYDHFSIDSNDISACDAAWPLVSFGMCIVTRVLDKVFGFRHFLLVYSGRRGAHLTVHDARACALTDEARAAIVSFLQPSDQPGRGGRHDFGRIIQHPCFAELFESHIVPFWEHFCLKSYGLLDSPIDREAFMDLFGDRLAKTQINAAALSGQVVWSKLRAFVSASKFKDSLKVALMEAVLCYVWPKLDANVTKLRNHLSKSIFSVHPKTGRICIPLVEAQSASFKPSECPTFTGVVAQEPNEGAAFQKAVAYFSAFLNKLKKSPTETWTEPRVNPSLKPEFSLVSSRKRGADDMGKLIHRDTKRFAVDAARVFCAIASAADPRRVTIFFYTIMHSDSAVFTVYPGCSPPTRAASPFSMDAILDAVDEASQFPDTEVCFGSLYTPVLFDPREEDRNKCAKRMRNLTPLLSNGVELCTLNLDWGTVATKSVLKEHVKDVWNTKHIHL